MSNNELVDLLVQRLASLGIGGGGVADDAVTPPKLSPAVRAKLAAAVTSVNGAAADSSGNVTVATGGGGQADTVDTLGGTGAAGRSVMKAADAAAIRALIDAATPAQITTAVQPKYTKPASGIPLADLVAAVQTSLGKADTASQPGHKHAAADLNATGTRDATTFLRGDNTWAVPAGGGGAANVELAYAEVTTKIAMPSTFEFADVPGLAITFAPGARPAMVDAYLATMYCDRASTWGFRVIRTSDGRVMAEGVADSSPDRGFPPCPPLKFRVPANAASTTYKVQTNQWVGSNAADLNSQAEAGTGHRIYISAVSV